MRGFHFFQGLNGKTLSRCNSAEANLTGDDLTFFRASFNRLSFSLGLLAVSFTALSSASAAEDFTGALVSAYQNNPRLMAERARVREVDENYVQAQAAGRVNASIAGSYGRTLTEIESQSFFGGTSVSDDWLTPRTGQLSVVKPLYQGGRVKGLKAQAKAGILSARQGLRNTEQNILLSAATAYLDVLRDEETARIRRNNVNVLSRQMQAANDRFDVGEGTRTDIAQAETRLAAAEIGLASADAQLAVSRSAYVRFVGHAPEQLAVPPQFALPENLADAQTRGRANNPQLVAARYNENATQSSILVAKAAGRPVLSLNGALQGSRRTSANVPRSESASVTAQIRIPLYAGGGNQSRVRAAKHANTRSKFETRELERALDQAVADLWAQVIAAERSLVASRKQVAAAEVAFEGVELEQQVGTRSTLDVLDAEQELLNAKLAVVQAERNLNVTGYQLLVTMGGFDAYSLQLPVDYYDPQQNLDEVSGNPFAKKYLPRPLANIVKEVPEVLEQGGKELLAVGGAIGKDVPVVGKIARQVPDIPKSALEIIAIDDPFDPEAKAANPDSIDLVPETVKVKEKADSP